MEMRKVTAIYRDGKLIIKRDDYGGCITQNGEFTQWWMTRENFAKKYAPEKGYEWRAELYPEEKFNEEVERNGCNDDDSDEPPEGLDEFEYIDWVISH